MAGIIISPRARIFHGHEWIYATEIKKSFGNPQPGDVITLKDFRDGPAGTAPVLNGDNTRRRRVNGFLKNPRKSTDPRAIADCC